MLTILKAITVINFLPCKIQSKWAFFKRNFIVSKYIFHENYRLVTYDIDIKDGLYFIVFRDTWQNGLFYKQQIAYTVMFLNFRTDRSEQTV